MDVQLIYKEVIVEGEKIHDSEDFLEVVYGDDDGWVDLPALAAGHWVPFHIQWPSDRALTRRIDTSLRDQEDLYYSVARFSARGRKIENVLPCHWLWADLDEVHPSEAARFGLMPTIAVESSPGRFQALWRLTTEVSPRALEKVNRGLTYALDADKGGWDLTQVLRVPFTRNFKYPDSPQVTLLWYKPELRYSVKAVWAKVKDSVPAAELRAATGTILPTKPIPAKARALLRTKPDEVVTGERSARLWELECLLAESGLSEQGIFDLVWGCAWNKWRSVREGRRRLERDVRRAMAHVRRQRLLGDGREQKVEVEDKEHEDKDSGTPHDLPFVGYGSFMVMKFSTPKWLIEDIWTAGSVGFVAGEPKTSKTTLALWMGLSVASGKPFLGEYACGLEGPVLMVQEENAPWMMQDRARKVARFMGLIPARGTHRGERAGRGALGKSSVELDFPRDVPFRLLNNWGFDLGLDEHRDMLEAEVERQKPVLLILDPLYLVFGNADEKSGADLRPYLKWILKLRYEYDCAVQIVHHQRKQTQGGPVVRPGQRMLGSTTLHGFSNSSLYTSALEEDRDGWIAMRVEREFREMAPQSPFDMTLTMGEVGDIDGLELGVHRNYLHQKMLEAVIKEPGMKLNDLAEILGLSPLTVKRRVLKHDGLELQLGSRGRGNATRVFLHENGNTR